LFDQSIALRVQSMIIVLLSLSVHEWAHAWSAHKLGDTTAEREGRLTLNPLSHMDPIGTFLLPLMGIPFGWAKPVPVNPANFRRGVNMSAGMAITAAAGPISNILLAIACAVITGVVWRVDSGVFTREPALLALLIGSIQVNIGLALFNLLPIPPLDGSRIVEHFVPYRGRDAWDTFRRFSPFLLLALIAGGGFVLGGPIAAMNHLLMKLMQTIATA
jgi:Zn-dependent protease